MSRTRAVRTAVVLTALACALALGGCSDDPEPKFAVPSETTTAPTPTASESANGPAEPTMPEAARGKGAAAAKAFVRHFWSMVNYAQKTGDVSGLSSLTRNCAGCNAGVKFIQDSHLDDGSIRGGRGRVSEEDVVFVQRDGKSWAVVEFLVMSTKQVVMDADGELVERFPAGPTRYRIYLEPIPDSWVARVLSVI